MSEIVNKSEKLASAIYLITSFFSDQEPIKWKIRSIVTEVVTLIVSLNNGFIMDKEAKFLEVRDNVSKITKLLSITKNAGLISQENHDLMQEEFVKYNNLFDSPANIFDLLKSDIDQPKLKESNQNIIVKDKEIYKTIKKPLKNFGAVSVKKNSRQSIIIGVLKRKKEVMIKDITPLISGCSEKTIQRELSAMVQTGLIKREGDKRWSRYSLA